MLLRFSVGRPAHRFCIIVVLLGGTLYDKDVGADVYRLSGELIPGTEGITLAPGAQLARRELESANLQQVDLSGAHFELSNLTNASLFGSTLLDANLSGANLTNASLVRSTLTNANLTNANLTNASLQSSTLSGVDFAGANITGIQLAKSQGFSEEQLYSTASYRANRLQGVELQSTDLAGWNLSGQNLAAAKLSGSVLTDANLARSNLTNANLSGSVLTDANLSGAVLVGASIASVTGLTGEQLYSTASYQTKNLQDTEFSGNDFTSWNLAGQNLFKADLARVKFSDTNLARAKLVCANLHRARFTNADLTGANLSNSNLASATFAGADLTGANVGGAVLDFRDRHGFTQEMLHSTASYQSQDLEGIVFVSTDLTGWDFSGQNLATASFHKSTLTEAHFEGANLINANLFGVGGLDTAVFDSETIYSRWTAFPDDFDPVEAGLTLIESTPGDFNGNGTLDATDMDLLSLVARVSRDAPYEDYWLPFKVFWPVDLFDVDASGQLDNGDRHTWVHDLKRTWWGDADFDGEFSSDDLVFVFRAGQYEDSIKDNSGWAEGDWNGDREFDSADLVVAFQDGGYAQGRRIAAKAVPEPAALASFLAGLIGLAIMSNSRRNSV